MRDFILRFANPPEHSKEMMKEFTNNDLEEIMKDGIPEEYEKVEDYQGTCNFTEDYEDWDEQEE